jgi:DNA-binding YbaB/EbfC family protein
VFNLQQMMGQMKKIQEEIQQQLDALRVEGSSGGGMVTVQVNGKKRILSVRIDPEALKEGDLEMLQDLVQASVNDAMRKVDDALAEKLGGLTGGLKIPGLFGS